MNTLLELTKHFASRGEVILLDSQSEGHPSSEVSYLAALPEATITAYENRIIQVIGGEELEFEQNPWRALQAFRQEVDDCLFGYLGYDLKNHIEKLESANRDRIEAPDMHFMVPKVIIAYNHRTQKMKVVKGELPANDTDSTASDTFSLGKLHLQTRANSYIQKIREAQHRIREGTFYEVNLSHQMRATFEGEPFELYKKMREVGPVPFGSFIKLKELSVCCQSPERFLRREGRYIYSQPIKGTTQRGTSAEEDQQLVETLISSEKERAENLMIVDLVRNDLSKIAKKGSVEVTELFGIQSFDTVHQMVSTIRAQSLEEDPVEIIKACFPMGSMTGAPKISAMDSIEGLEAYKRGIYSGAIGYIKPEGTFDFNVVIRTAIIRDDCLYYSAGGAITGDSDPQKEWEETKIKARALLHAVEHSLKG